MKRGHAHLLVHIIYSTIGQEKLIPFEFRERISSYLKGILRGENCPALEVAVQEDHVHLLVQLDATQSLQSLVMKLKSQSARWLNDLEDYGQRFAWQEDWLGFSVSASQAESVASFLRGQDDYHGTRSFADEAREFCQRHGIEWDAEKLLG